MRESLEFRTEKTPFLSEEAAQDETTSPRHSVAASLWRHQMLLIHFGLITLYTIVFAIAFRQVSKSPTTSIFPIENLDMRYTPAKYGDFEVSPYSGPPSPLVDKMWHELLETTTIRVTAEELKRSNQTSVELPNGGYMAWLGVFHELHCIKMLRQWNYRSHYHPNLTAADQPHWDIHADHCFEVLRSAAMCHADTTLTTFGWADQPKPMLNTRLIDHKCVDWGALSASVAHRAVPEGEMQSMVNPNGVGASES